MLLYIDIETIPSQTPGAKDSVRQSVKPPGTYKKPESIAAWHATEGEAAAEEAYRRQSLDGGLQGEIVSIAICDDHDRHFVHCRRSGDSEADLLTMAFDRVEAWTVADAEAMRPAGSECFPCDDHYLVAHNAAFDIGFLWRRATVHGIQRPRWLPGPMARVGRDYGCTMLTWAGHGNRVSLDNLCRVLGVGSPKDGDITGATVFDAWLAGRHQEIADYNLADAMAAREVHHRLAGLPRAA